MRARMDVFSNQSTHKKLLAESLIVFHDKRTSSRHLATQIMVRVMGRLAVVQGERVPSDWLLRRAGLFGYHSRGTWSKHRFVFWEGESLCGSLTTVCFCRIPEGTHETLLGVGGPNGMWYPFLGVLCALERYTVGSVGKNGVP